MNRKSRILDFQFQITRQIGLLAAVLAVATRVRAADLPAFTDPLVSSGGASAEIVVRSASWGTNPLHCRSAFRGSAPKDHRNQRDGFRVARELSTGK